MWIQTDVCRRRGPLTLMFFALVVVAAVPLQADEPANSTPATKANESKPRQRPQAAKKQRRRLPNHFAKLVTDEQRETIYKIQQRYRGKIESLRQQIEQLITQRNAEIRQVLTPEQQRKLDELLAKSRRSRGRSKTGRKTKPKSASSADATSRSEVAP